MDKKFTISVVVITRNEEKNIEDCLSSVNWADELVVLDDFSSDETITKAKKFTDRIFQRKMDIEGAHRNYAYSLAKNEWVLSLDADEMVSLELKDEIIKALSNNPRYTAFSIPLRNFIGDYWVRYGGWYPAGKLRLFRKDKFRYEEVGVHPRVLLDGECGHLKCDIIHKGYPDFEHFLSSLNRQTTLEAQKWIDDKRRIGIGKMLFKAIDRFIRSFISKKGYKDGFIGFMVAYLASLYQVMSYAKYWQMKRKLKRGK